MARARRALGIENATGYPHAVGPSGAFPTVGSEQVASTMSPCGTWFGRGIITQAAKWIKFVERLTIRQHML